MNNRKCYFIYPRDMQGNLTGHTICVMSHDGGVFHGTALCGPNDNFEKKLGRELAKERAEETIRKYDERCKQNSKEDEATKSENLLLRLFPSLKGK